MKKIFTFLVFLLITSLSYGQSATYKMSKVFKGGYSESEIKKKLDVCIRLYGYTPSEENYNKFGSVLLSLAESDGFAYKEMELLDCVIKTKQKAPKSNLKYSDTAATCSVLMSSNRR